MAVAGRVGAPIAGIDARQVEEHRLRRFRQRPELRLRDQDDAAAFVDDVGICLFQAHARAGDLLPNLYGAAVGRPGPAPPWSEWDRSAHDAWHWKDRLFSSGRVYYGKPLGDFRLLLSRRLLPYVHAACAPGPTYEEGDYLELYRDGLLGEDARHLYEALLRIGAGSTAKLRRTAFVERDKRANARFDRALTELQRAFLVAAVGVDDDNAWKYTFRYAPLARAFPAEVARAAALSRRDAIRGVVAWVVGLSLVVPAARAGRLFDWDGPAYERALEAMVEAGVVRRQGDCLISMAV